MASCIEYQDSGPIYVPPRQEVLNRKAVPPSNEITLVTVWKELFEVPKPRQLDVRRYLGRYLDDQRSGRLWTKA